MDSPSNRPSRPFGPLLFGALGAFCALGLTLGPPWPLTLVANLVHVVAAFGLLALPFVWRAGHRQLASLGVGAILTLALVLGSRWIAGPVSVRADEPISGSQELRVLTYNLGCDLAGGAALGQVLASSDADLIALQELSNANALLCADALAGDYPHRVLFPSGIPGRGLFSRWPIVGWEWTIGRQERRHLRVELDIDGRSLVLWILHLSMRMSFLDRTCVGAEDLAAIIARDGDRDDVVLVGDFNTTERSATWRRLRDAGLTDAFRSAGRGPGFTFPIGNRYLGIPAPTCVRIDYVWHGPALCAERAHVGPDGGSDHYPVIVDLRWVNDEDLSVQASERAR